MDMPQPTRLTPLAWGSPEDIPASEQEDHTGTARALLALVGVLAVATIAYVAYPALQHKPAPAVRTCEVIILESGAPDCVTDPSASVPASPTTRTGAVRATARKPAPTRAPHATSGAPTPSG